MYCEIMTYCELSGWTVPQVKQFDYEGISNTQRE